MKGHQPLDRFCWKMEILSVLSLSMSALHDLAVFVPRVKLWRSISTVPAHERDERQAAQSRWSNRGRMFGTMHRSSGRTQEVVGGEPLKVPHLQDKDGRKLLLGFIQREDALPLPHRHYLKKRRRRGMGKEGGMTSAEHGIYVKCPLVNVSGRDLLCRQVVEREDEAPVEVSFTGQRVVVDVRLLSVVFQAFQPSEGTTGCEAVSVHV